VGAVAPAPAVVQATRTEIGRPSSSMVERMDGDSYRLKQSVGSRRTSARAEQNQATSETVDPETGEITAA